MPSFQPYRGWLYDLILFIFAPLLDLFFREIQVRGAWRVPKHGAVILVAAPHANQFVDSLVLMRIMRSVHRRVSWLMAAKSFKVPVIGSLARGIEALPVARAMDSLKTGEGRVYLVDDVHGSPHILRGVETQFTGPEFQVGGMMHITTGAHGAAAVKLEIVAITDVNQLTVKNLPAKEIVDMLRSPEAFHFKVAPKIDQTAVYNAVFNKLEAEGCVGIFPEGGSHDRTNLLSLQAGIAVMALGALSQGIDVSIVPVGLTYFHPHKFRSRAVVEFGDPVKVPESIVKDFQEGKRRESIGGLLSSIREALLAVTTTAPDIETMMLVRTARRLFFSRRKHVPQSAALEINRRFVKGYTQHKTDPEIQRLTRAIKQYSQLLEHLSLRDHQVDYARFSWFRQLLLLLYRTGKLLLLSIGTIPGLLLFAPVFIAARYYSHKKRREALAGSSVKVYGHDVVATWKILVAGGLAPLLYTYYAVLLALWARYNHINRHIPSSTPTYTVVMAAYAVFPAMTYAALRFGEIGMDLVKSIWPLMLCLSSKSSALEDLRQRRADLAKQVTDVVNQLGPDMFPDCEHEQPPFPTRVYGDISPFESLNEMNGKEFFTEDLTRWS